MLPPRPEDILPERFVASIRGIRGIRGIGGGEWGVATRRDVKQPR